MSQINMILLFQVEHEPPCFGVTHGQYSFYVDARWISNAVICPDAALLTCTQKMVSGGPVAEVPPVTPDCTNGSSIVVKRVTNRRGEVIVDTFCARPADQGIACIDYLVSALFGFYISISK